MPTLAQHVRILVIGAGFSGIGAAIALTRAGETDLLVLERSDGVGGTWRANTYPGCACDVPSHLYSYSFAPNPGWTRSFSRQGEILDYVESVVDRFGVRDRIRFGVTVTGADWDDAQRRWRVCTDAGTVTADLLVSAAGPLSDPSLPDLPGRETFTGEILHSGAWRPRTPIAGRRVVVVGTGASAIQLVPQLAGTAAHLTVFQRTPPWVLPRADRPISSRMRRLFRAVPLTQRVARLSIFTSREAMVPAFVRFPVLMRLVRRVATRHLHAQVADPRLRRLLTPDYLPGCKRLLLSNDYYPALTRPDVTLVPAAVTGFDGDDVLAADGSRHPADLVVFATGFEVQPPPISQVIRGRGGASLAQTWLDQGSQALRGMTVRGFPNLFFLLGPHSGLGHSSMVYVLESQLAYLVSAVQELAARGVAVAEPTQAAQRRWDGWLQPRMPRTIWATGGCSSWYQGEDGTATALWPAGLLALRRATRHFDPSEYDLLPGPGPQPRRSDVRSADGTRLAVEVLEPLPAAPADEVPADEVPADEAPPPAPTIVLSHGWTLRADYWAPVVELLRPHARVVLFDQRGHGSSAPAGSTGYTTQALADDLAAVLDAQPEGVRCVVVGHSMGAMGLVSMAARHPQVLQRRVAAAVLTSTGMDQLMHRSGVSPVPRRLARYAEPLVRRGLGSPWPLRLAPEPVARAIVRWLTLSPCADAAQTALTTRVIRSCAAPVHAGFGAMLAELDLSDAVRALDVPAVVIGGTRDRLTPLWHARRLAAALPQCTGSVELAGIGHMTPQQSPQAIAEAALGLAGAALGLAGALEPLPANLPAGGERLGSAR